MMTTAQAVDVNYTIPGGGDFHPPRSAAEKALEKIFKYDADDGGIADYLLGVPHRDVQKDKNFAGLFTLALRDAVSSEETKEISDCGGVYDEGGRCGLEFSPVICAQDIPDYYLYRIERQDKGKAIITLGFAKSLSDDDPYPAATYSMVKRGTDWVVDGILCQNGFGSYNFRDFDAVKGLTSKLREQ